MTHTSCMFISELKVKSHKFALDNISIELIIKHLNQVPRPNNNLKPELI